MSGKPFFTRHLTAANDCGGNDPVYPPGKYRTAVAERCALHVGWQHVNVSALIAEEMGMALHY